MCTEDKQQSRTSKWVIHAPLHVWLWDNAQRGVRVQPVNSGIVVHRWYHDSHIKMCEHGLAYLTIKDNLFMGNSEKDNRNLRVVVPIDKFNPTINFS